MHEEERLVFEKEPQIRSVALLHFSFNVKHDEKKWENIKERHFSVPFCAAASSLSSPTRVSSSVLFFWSINSSSTVKLNLAGPVSGDEYQIYRFGICRFTTKLLYPLHCTLSTPSEYRLSITVLSSSQSTVSHSSSRYSAERRINWFCVIEVALCSLVPFLGK